MGSARLFCCALITLGGIAQAGHTHADGQAVQSDCAICHAAHLVVQPAVAQSLPRTVLVVVRVSTAPQPIRTQDLVENDSTFHTDVDRGLFQKLPLESQSSSVSSLVTLASPGVAADSNGLFHGLGDHASNSFSVDGQPITDQQSKVFSNQIPSNSIQSLEVISGAPPAEFGGKTSLVIEVTTRGSSMWVCAVTSTTGSPSPATQNRAWASATA